jgi:hypothetical protein
VALEAGREHEDVGRSVPSSVRIPVAVTSPIRSATRSTFGLVSVGYHSSVSMIRLQPTSSRGVTLRRSSGSSMALVICRRATARKTGRSHALLVSAAVPSSMKPKIAARSARWSAGKRSKRRCVRGA